MLILMTSPDAVAPHGEPSKAVVDVLKKIRAEGNPVGVISNKEKPAWFEKAFEGTKVQFLRTQARQNGEIVISNAKRLEVQTYDVLVLAAKQEDVSMGKNGGAVLIGAGWVANDQVSRLGILAEDPSQLLKIIQIGNEWNGHWWTEADGPTYKVKALANLSGKNQTTAQQEFGSRLTSVVKQGGAGLNALLAITSRSLFIDKYNELEGSLWGVYPSSRSANDDTEILSDFTHRLRTTVSNVRFCKRGEPLFIRHRESIKRSLSGSVDRTDPSDQLTSLHLNPFYSLNARLAGRHVVILDDCTTYGVSFGVASAFLRKAGARSITGVALGKFGSQLRQYEIEILTDPFKPVSKEDFRIHSSKYFPVNTRGEVQKDLLALL